MRQEHAWFDRHHGDGRRRNALYAPDVYLQKIAVGPGYAKGVVELDATPADNVKRLAKATMRRGWCDPLRKPYETGVDMYIGTGGTLKGVLAAVALRCIGGQMQC